MKVRESDALAMEPVETWRAHGIVAVAGQVAVALVVSDYKDDVGSAVSGPVAPCRCRKTGGGEKGSSAAPRKRLAVCPRATVRSTCHSSPVPSYSRELSGWRSPGRKLVSRSLGCTGPRPCGATPAGCSRTDRDLRGVAALAAGLACARPYRPLAKAGRKPPPWSRERLPLTHEWRERRCSERDSPLGGYETSSRRPWFGPVVVDLEPASARRPRRTARLRERVVALASLQVLQCVAWPSGGPRRPPSCVP